MVTTNPLLKRESAFLATSDQAMSLNGVVNKTGILLAICVAMACYGWLTPAWHGGLIMLPFLAGFVFSIVAMFKPTASPILAPLYAAAEGLVLGAVSEVFNVRYPGIVANAVILTFSVLGLFLFLYATRIVRVTRGMWIAVFAATSGIVAVYLIDMGLRLFHVQMPLIHESGTIGIGLSLFICVIAAMNFFLDFDVIENFIRAGAPKYMEWYSGMALLITLVWLYLEVLRLLSKLQSRR